MIASHQKTQTAKTHFWSQHSISITFPWKTYWMWWTIFRTSSTTDDRQSAVRKITPPRLKRPINLANLENGRYDRIVLHSEEVIEVTGLEADRELPVSKMATTAMTVNTQNQPKNAEQQQLIYYYDINIIKYRIRPGHVNKQCTVVGTENISKDEPPPHFHIVVKKGHLETPSATTELQFKVGKILFRERLKVTTNLTSLIMDRFLL